jgi:hypothetical protein
VYCRKTSSLCCSAIKSQRLNNFDDIIVFGKTQADHENDIGIVSVDDLVDNEVLVIKEKVPMDGKAQWGYGGSGRRYGADGRNLKSPTFNGFEISFGDEESDDAYICHLLHAFQ